MSLILPFSDSGAHASGGLYSAATAAEVTSNYPSIAMFFPCNEATGATALTCRKTGVIVSGGSGNTNNGDGTISLQATHNVVTGGTVPAPNGKHVLLLTLGKPSSTGNNIGIGTVASGAGKGFQVHGVSAQTHKSADGSTLVTEAVTAADIGDGSKFLLRAMQLAYASATGMRLFNWDGTTFEKPGAGKTATSIAGQTSPAALDQSAGFGATTRPAMILLLYLTTPLSDAFIEGMVKWMYAYPTNKWIYPGLREIS